MSSVTHDELQAAIQQLTVLLKDTGKDDGDRDPRDPQEPLDWTALAQLAQQCANSLRTEQARTTLGETTVIPITSNLLSQSTSSKSASPSSSSSPSLSSSRLACQTQLCRIVGNLVLDHPSNRTKCLDAAIPERILGLLAHLHSDETDDPLTLVPTIKAATGALLNLVIDTPTIRNLLSKTSALEVLSKNVTLYSVGDWSQSATESSGAAAVQLRATTVEWTLKLIAELLSGENTVMPPATGVALSQAVLSLPLPSTPSFDNSTAVCASFDFEDIYSLVETDLTILATATELLEDHSYRTEALHNAIAFATSSSDHRPKLLLQAFMDYLENAELLPSYLPVAKHDQANDNALEIEKTFSHIKASVGRTLVGLVGSDRVMIEAFQAKDSSLEWLVSRCIAWLEGRSDLIITSSTMLANLARKDQFCVSLVHDHGIGKPLARLLQEYSRAPANTAASRPGEATQILHGVTGLLRNLAIPGPNKQILCDLDVIEPCAGLLKPELDMVLPLQNSAVGILKHLCSGNITSSLKVILPASLSSVSSATPMSAIITTSAVSTTDPPAPLTIVLALIKRTNDVRLRCEATRLIVNLVRSLYSSRSITSPITPAAVNGLELSIVKNKAKQILEHSAEAVDALNEMLRTGEKYPILVNESIVALTLLSTTTSGAKLVLDAITTRHEVPSPAAGEATREDGPAVDRPRTQTNGYSSTANSRANSLAAPSKYARSSSLEVLLKWLDDYAIQVPVMQPEMVGNVLSLLESLLRMEDGRAKSKLLEGEQPALKASLQAVVRSGAEGPAAGVVRAGAESLLSKLDS